MKGEALAASAALVAQGRWSELLALCRASGLNDAHTAVMWLTAACALDDAREITACIAALAAIPEGHPLFRNGQTLNRLLALLETTNHSAQAAELILLLHGRMEWTPTTVKKASRMTRTIAEAHPRLAAELLVLVAGKAGWSPSESTRAELLARVLADDQPELAAGLLLAIVQHDAWSEAQREVARRVLKRLAECTPVPRDTVARLRKAVAAWAPQAAAERQVKNPSVHAFPPWDAADTAFVAPRAYTFTIHRNNPELNACVARFTYFYEEFLGKYLPGRTPPVYHIENAYVNGIGQIWTTNGTIVNQLGQEIERMDPGPVQVVEHGISMTTRTKGIYHWLVESLPAASWITRPGAEDVRIVVPAGLPAFKAASFRLAGIDDGRLVPLQGEVCLFRNLHYTRVSLFNLFFVQDFYTRFITRALAQAGVAPAARIYVSRRDSSRRVLQNEAELEAALAARGFTIVVLSGMALADQVALFARASIVVAPHGGGLTHLIFARPGTTVVEIVPTVDQISDKTIHLRFNYARTSIIKGFNYHLVLERCHMVLDTWQADLPPILRLIDSLL